MVNRESLGTSGPEKRPYSNQEANKWINPENLEGKHDFALLWSVGGEKKHKNTKQSLHAGPLKKKKSAWALLMQSSLSEELKELYYR